MKNLKVYGDMYSSMVSQIQSELRGNTDEELKQIEIEAKSVSMVNCPFTEYEVARSVLDFIHFEQANRRV